MRVVGNGECLALCVSGGMIRNSVCPYCRKLMVKAENQENSRSVEHLIPNAALTRKRKNDEGDFYACRKCNSRKSHIDYVLGTVAKCQMDNSETAADSLIKAVKKDDVASKRFIKMIQSHREQVDGVHMTLPIKGEELVEYIEFLGKGQYFKKHKIPYNPNTQVFNIRFGNKAFIQSFQESYRDKHGTNCFRDLEQNERTEVINGGECLIYQKNKGYMFVFHDYTVITIKVLRKNRKNILRCNDKTEKLISDFNKYT